MITHSGSRERERALILGIGELLWDILPSGARLGGAISNFSIFCARLGNQAKLITSVGDDQYGRAALEALSEQGSMLEYLQIDPEHPTGTVEVTLSDAQQPSYRITEGVAWDYIRVTDKLQEAFYQADAVCFGTLCQRSPVSRATIRTLIAATRQGGERICDVNVRLPYCSAELLQWSMAHATIIKVSDEELPYVVFTLGLHQAALSAEEAAQALLAAFPQAHLVAMTLGSHGCMLIDRKRRVTHPGFPIKLVDPVGAGDAFTAGLTHALLHGADLAQAAEIANMCGSSVAAQPGASPLLPASFTSRIDSILYGENAKNDTSLVPE